MENVKNKNYFLITCVSCVVLLLTMCYFGVNTVSYKGTYSSGTTCHPGETKITSGGQESCCPNFDGGAKISNGYCVPKNVTLHATDTGSAYCEYGVELSLKLTDREIEAYEAYAMDPNSPGGGIPYWFVVNHSTVQGKFLSQLPGGYSRGWRVINNSSLEGYCSMSDDYVLTCEPDIFEAKVSDGCATQPTPVIPDTSDDINTWILTLDANGGIVNGGATDTMTCTTKPGESTCDISLPEATREGYEFNGWMTSQNNCSAITSGSMLAIIGSNNEKRYACWIQNKTFKATFDANGGTLNGSSELTCNTNTSSCQITQIPTASRNGHTFKGWGTSSSCTSGNTNTFIYLNKESTNYFACWEQTPSNPGGGTGETPSNPGGGSSVKTHTITFKDGNTTLGTRSCTTNGVDRACVVPVYSPSPSKTGHTFDGWTTGGNDCDAGQHWFESLSVVGDITVYACYNVTGSSGGDTPSGGETEKDFYAIFDPNDGELDGEDVMSCSTTGSSCSISSLPTASKDGYTFKGWGTSSSCTSGSKTSLTLNSESKTYYACYVKNSSSSNENVSDNPQTGQIFIFIVWVVGFVTFAYSMWYVYNLKKSNNN